jgi:hypothetical protein
MRDFMSYLIAGVLLVLAMDFVAPFGPSASAWPELPVKPIEQIVNRGGKGDRLLVPTAIKPQQPQKRPTMMVGCDPAISPMSVSAYANFAARCVV